MNMKDRQLDYKEIIMDLSVNERLITDRLKKIKEFGKSIENSPKTIIVDIITTSQLFVNNRDNYRNIINRDMEIDFEDEFIEERDIAFILLDYFADTNLKYYQNKNYYKVLNGLIVE